VIAPSLVPVQTSNRVKTDRRDAAKLAHFLRSGDLTTIHVPDEATEAIRDLERAREDAKRTEQVAGHQLTKFLLRHERWYEGKVNWNTAHLAWIGKQQFALPSQQKVLTDYLVAVEQAAGWACCTHPRDYAGAVRRPLPRVWGGPDGGHRRDPAGAGRREPRKAPRHVPGLRYLLNPSRALT
jgi:hypothetical protein